MIDSITLAGNSGTPVKHSVTASGLSVASFRLAVTPRIRDRASGEWRDGDTNWFTVTSFGRLADNTAASLESGQRVLVHGELRVRNWTTTDGKSGTTAEVVADSIGHDLNWLVTTARRPAALSGGAGAASTGADATAESGAQSGWAPSDPSDDGDVAALTEDAVPTPF